MLDVAPDDALAMNKQRRIMRWDAKKRKFVTESNGDCGNQGKRQRRPQRANQWRWQVKGATRRDVRQVVEAHASRGEF